MKVKFVLFLLILIGIKSFSQPSAALPFMTLQQSPFLFGAGQTGVAIPMKDPIGFYFNPALLGRFSENSRFSFLFMPQETKWASQNDIKFNTYGFSGGYNLSGMLKGFPLYVGIGYLHNNIDFNSLGPQSSENFDAFSLGIGTKVLVNFSLGISIKKFESTLVSIGPDKDLKPTTADGTAYDFGALVTAPVSELLFDNVLFELNNEVQFKPDVNFSLGYSLSNVGDKIAYDDELQPDPISRTARLGYSANFGVDFVFKQNAIKAFDYLFTAEAQDLLVKETLLDTEYQGMFGQISLGKHLIGLNGDENVIVHKGHIINLFETLSLAYGSFVGSGNTLEAKTDGIVVSTKGLGKLLIPHITNSYLSYLLENLSFEYYNTNAFVDSRFETNFKGVAVFLTI